MSRLAIVLIVGLCTFIAVFAGFALKHFVGRRREAQSAYRRVRLLKKYRDEDSVEKIMSGMIWREMTRDQLIDSWGAPNEEIAENEASRRVEVFKYLPRPGRPFGQRVILQKGRVIGWDTKGMNGPK